MGKTVMAIAFLSAFAAWNPDEDLNGNRGLVASIPICGQTSALQADIGLQDGQIDPADKQFVTDAAEAGLTEVKLGELAASKAKDSEVKKFAQLMVKDHSAANEELKTLASKKGLNVPAQCTKCQPKYDELNALSGDAFDRKYASMMVADHQEAVSKFEGESKNGKDNEIRGWAGQKLPVLKHHLSMANDLNGKKGG
jgi:putative membrane protein